MTTEPSHACIVLYHNSRIFHNFLIAANLVDNSYFWTADWLGNPCALLYAVTESSQVAGRLLAVSFLHWSYEPIVAHCCRHSFERPVQIPDSMEIIGSNGPISAFYFDGCNYHSPFHLPCSFGFFPFFLRGLKNQNWSWYSNMKCQRKYHIEPSISHLRFRLTPVCGPSKNEDSTDCGPFKLSQHYHSNTFIVVYLLMDALPTSIRENVVSINQEKVEEYQWKGALHRRSYDGIWKWWYRQKRIC